MTRQIAVYFNERNHFTLHSLKLNNAEYGRNDDLWINLNLGWFQFSILRVSDM